MIPKNISCGMAFQLLRHDPEKSTPLFRQGSCETKKNPTARERFSGRASFTIGPFGPRSKAEAVPQCPFLQHVEHAADGAGGHSGRKFPMPGAEEAEPPRQKAARLRHQLQFRLVAVARLEHRAHVAEAVDEAERGAALGAPEKPGEEIRIVGEPLAAPFPDEV